MEPEQAAPMEVPADGASGAPPEQEGGAAVPGKHRSQVFETLGLVDMVHAESAKDLQLPSMGALAGAAKANSRAADAQNTQFGLLSETLNGLLVTVAENHEYMRQVQQTLQRQEQETSDLRAQLIQAVDGKEEADKQLQALQNEMTGGNAEHLARTAALEKAVVAMQEKLEGLDDAGKFDDIKAAFGEIHNQLGEHDRTLSNHTVYIETQRVAKIVIPPPPIEPEPTPAPVAAAAPEPEPAPEPQSRPSSREKAFSTGTMDLALLKKLAGKIMDNAPAGPKFSVEQIFNSWRDHVDKVIANRPAKKEPLEPKKVAGGKSLKARFTTSTKKMMTVHRMGNAFMKPAERSAKAEEERKKREEEKRALMEEELERMHAEQMQKQQLLQDVAWLKEQLRMSTPLKDTAKPSAGPLVETMDARFDLMKQQLEQLGKDAESVKREQLEATRLAKEQLAQMGKDLENTVASSGNSGAQDKRLKELESQLSLLKTGQDTSLRKDVNSHAKQLADILTRKAGKEELEALAKGMGDNKSELEKKTNSFVKMLADHKERLASDMGVLGETLTTKADAHWLNDMETRIRAEVETLRRSGARTVSKDVLDAKLNALREAVAQQLRGQDDAKGSAAFRCLACNRPLPQPDNWTPPPAQSHRPSVPVGPRKQGTPSTKERPPSRDDFEPEIVYRAGFPTIQRQSMSSPERLSRPGSRDGMNSSSVNFNHSSQSAGFRGSNKHVLPAMESHPRSLSSASQATLSGDGIGLDIVVTSQHGLTPAAAIPHFEPWGRSPSPGMSQSSVGGY